MTPLTVPFSRSVSSNNFIDWYDISTWYGLITYKLSDSRSQKLWDSLSYAQSWPNRNQHISWWSAFFDIGVLNNVIRNELSDTTMTIDKKKVKVPRWSLIMFTKRLITLYCWAPWTITNRISLTNRTGQTLTNKHYSPFLRWLSFYYSRSRKIEQI